MKLGKLKRSTRHAMKEKWLSENELRLEEKYAGMWVAISDEGFAGAGASFGEAEETAIRAGCVDPLVVPIKATAYQGTYLIRRWL